MRKLLLFLIWLYQKSRPFRPACCRFYPTCSDYAYGCVEKHGVLKGSVLTLMRVARCNPFCTPGLDEVPEQFSLGTSPNFVSKQV